MKFDQPLQMDTSVKIYETPKIDITAEQFKDGYMKAFQETAKTVYAIGKKFSQVDREIEENKEFSRVEEEIAEARAIYLKTYENLEKMNLSDENWRENRDKALGDLRTTEFGIINNSKLNNNLKEQFAKNSNSYYREKGVKNVLALGEYTRQANITTATQRISDSYQLFAETDNQSERDYLINSINNNKRILIKYGVNEEKLNSEIVGNLSKSLQISTKNQIDNLFSTLDPKTAAAQANQLILDNAQKYTASVCQIDGMEKTNAFDLMEAYYKQHKTFFGQYINARKIKVERNIKAQEKLQKDIKKTETKTLGMINDYDVFGIIQELEGTEYTTSQLLFDVDTQEKLYGENILGFGEEGNLLLPKLVSKKDIDLNIKKNIEALKNDGYSKEQATLNSIYNFTDEKSGGNEKIERSLLKSLALEYNINPTVVLKGKKNPAFISTWEIYKGGDADDIDFVEGRFLGKGRQRFERLLTKSQENNQPIPPKVLARYISGVIEKNQNPKIKSRIKSGYNQAVKALLDNDDYYSEIEKVLPILYEVFVSPKLYRRAPLKESNILKGAGERIIENNMSEREEELNEEESGYGIL